MAGQKRKVRLRGGCLPFQGAGWGGTLRTTTTWYPGNAVEATTQVLGPTEKNSTFTGFWRTTQMLRVPAVLEPDNAELTQADDLKLVLDDIYRSGQRLRVSWVNNGFAIEVREGRCVDWDFAYDRRQDIGWTAVFEWVSRGGIQAKVASRTSSGADAALKYLEIQAGKALAAVEANDPNLRGRNVDTSSFNDFDLDSIDRMLDGPKDLMQDFSRAALNVTSRVNQIGGLIAKTRALPASLANQALDVANNAVAVCNQFLDTMSRRPAEANTLSTKVSQIVDATSTTTDALNAADGVRRAAEELRQQTMKEARKNSQILAVHVVRKTELLTDISAFYYGTAEQASSIARMNNLPLSQTEVERGAILIVPTLDAIHAYNESQ